MKSVVLLCGGKSAEHEISLLSTASVASNLDLDSYRVAVLGIRRDGSSYPADEIRRRLALTESSEIEFPSVDHWLTYLRGLDRERCVVFPVLHGPYGEDGTVQGVLEVLDLAYVGAGVGGSAVGMNKLYCKGILLAAGLPVLPWVSVSRHEWLADAAGEAKRVLETLGFPVFVKPANMGSSIGINRVDEAAGLGRAVTEALEYDEKILVEKAIDARELEISVLGSDDEVRLSVPGEIVPEDTFYSYEAKYLKQGSRLLIPAPISDRHTEQIRELARAAYQVLQLDGMARLDFLLQKDSGETWINEPNTIPGFTQISMYPKLWEATGLPYRDLLSDLIRLGIERWRRRSRLRFERRTP